MSESYKILASSNEHASYVFEELEVMANIAARDGYTLKTRSINLFCEDRGQSQVPLYHAVAVMVKVEKKPKKACETDAVLP